MEFPQVRAPRADLLGETTTKSGQLVHIELQSGNTKNMAIRMLEYGLAVLRKHRRYPNAGCDEDEPEICVHCGARWDWREVCEDWCETSRPVAEPVPVDCLAVEEQEIEAADK